MTVAQWVQTHPRESVVRTLGVLFNAGVGALLVGLAAYGPLRADSTGVIVLAAAGAIAYGGLWFGQQRMTDSGREQVARRWRRGLIVLPFLFVLIIVALSALQLYRVGQIMMPTQDRVAGFERLWSAMNTAYPYFDTKGIDWGAVHDRYRPQVEADETDGEYYTVIAQMLGSLDDGHTYLVRPFQQRRYNFAGVIQTDDGVRTTTIKI